MLCPGSIRQGNRKNLDADQTNRISTVFAVRSACSMQSGAGFTSSRAYRCGSGCLRRPRPLRYFLPTLQGAALRVFLRVVAQRLRAHYPGSGPSARVGAIAFIHRFGSTLNAHLHFHRLVIEGVFESAAAAGVIFRAATGLDGTPSPRCSCAIGSCAPLSGPSCLAANDARDIAQCGAVAAFPWTVCMSAFAMVQELPFR